jgi:hexosaminidase
LYQTPVIIDSSITVKTLTLGVNQRRGNRKDIRFDKQSYLVAANVDKSSLKEGVRCSYYEEAFRSVSEVDEAEPKETVILSRIEFPAHRRAELFGLKFDGFLYVQKDGIYSFYLSSDDGSSLTIGDRLVVNNDGPHGEKEVGGQVALQKGYHPYTLRYFDGGGGNKLTLQYQPPGQIVQDIPSSGLKIKP